MLLQMCTGIVQFLVWALCDRPTKAIQRLCRAGLEKSSVLPVLDRFLKLKTDLFLNKKLKNRSIKPCFSQDFAIHRLTLLPVRIVHT